MCIEAQAQHQGRNRAMCCCALHTCDPPPRSHSLRDCLDCPRTAARLTCVGPAKTNASLAAASLRRAVTATATVQTYPKSQSQSRSPIQPGEFGCRSQPDSRDETLIGRTVSVAWARLECKKGFQQTNM
jgi:hypothetical protein